VNETLRALKSYTPDVKRPNSAFIPGNTSDTVNRIIKNNENIANDAVRKLEKLTRQANKKAKNNTTRKTITNSVFDSIKDIDTKTLKGVGIVVGAMAALGIANNLLHQERTDSPLKPARKKDGNTKPNMWDKFTDGPQIKYKQDQLQQVEQQQRALKKDLSDYGVNDEQEMTQQAPSSPITTPTVYHDRQSGLNFKVSAKTKSKISDANNAKLIKMAGGGNAAIQSQADTSGVTDNWLANKFAELV